MPQKNVGKWKMCNVSFVVTFFLFSIHTVEFHVQIRSNGNDLEQQESYPRGQAIWPVNYNIPTWTTSEYHR